jgi:hypothetical protein
LHRRSKTLLKHIYLGGYGFLNLVNARHFVLASLMLGKMPGFLKNGI